MKQMRKAFLILLTLALLFSAAACGSTKNVDLSAVYTEVTESADLPEMMDITADQAQNYYGIKADDCKQMIMKISSDGLRVDEIWMIETKDESTADSIEKLAESRIDQIMSETENYLPDQYKVASEGLVIRSGCIVALFMTTDSADMSIAFQKAIG